MGKVDELMELVAMCVNKACAMTISTCNSEREIARREQAEYRKLASELRASLSACVAEWLPITDEQCDGRTYIVGRDMGEWGFVRGYGRFHGTPGAFVSGWVCRGFTDPPGELGLGHPTHYQPLPPPPTETDGETK